jgi:hypothetical protein
MFRHQRTPLPPFGRGACCVIITLTRSSRGPDATTHLLGNDVSVVRHSIAGYCRQYHQLVLGGSHGSVAHVAHLPSLALSSQLKALLGCLTVCNHGTAILSPSVHVISVISRARKKAKHQNMLCTYIPVWASDRTRVVVFGHSGAVEGKMGRLYSGSPTKYRRSCTKTCPLAWSGLVAEARPKDGGRVSGGERPLICRRDGPRACATSFSAG